MEDDTQRLGCGGTRHAGRQQPALSLALRLDALVEAMRAAGANMLVLGPRGRPGSRSTQTALTS